MVWSYQPAHPVKKDQNHCSRLPFFSMDLTKFSVLFSNSFGPTKLLVKPICIEPSLPAVLPLVWFSFCWSKHKNSNDHLSDIAQAIMGDKLCGAHLITLPSLIISSWPNLTISQTVLFFGFCPMKNFIHWFRDDCISISDLQDLRYGGLLQV